MPMSDFQLIIFISKFCVLLALAWCFRFAIGNRNPKGVVLIWRIQIVAVALVGVGLLVPPLWSFRVSQIDSVPTNDSIAAYVDPGDGLANTRPTFLRSLINDDSQDACLQMNTALQEVVPSERQTESDSLAFAIDLAEPPRENLETQTQQSPDVIGATGLPVSEEFQATSGDKATGATTTIQSPESVSKDRARTLSNVLIWIWFIGFGFGLSRLTVMIIWIRDLDRNARAVSLESLGLPSWFCNLVNPNRIQIKESKSVSSPCLIGVFKPTILLPRALLKKSKGNSSIHAAIAHELMHVKGFDMAWHILLQLQQTILWPLPLVWWVSRSHSFACERVCDEAASALTKNREGYRSDLAKLALAVLNSNHQPFLLSMVKRPEINRRLSLLALRPPVLHVGLRLKTALLATISLAVLLGVTGSSEFRLDEPNSYTSDAVNEPNDPTLIEPTNGVHDEPETEEVTAENTAAGTDEPKANVTPTAIASTKTDSASALQSKTAKAQSFVVHSDLNPVPKKRIKPSPVNSGLLIHGRITDTDGLPIDKATLTVGMFTHDTPTAQNKTIPLIKFTTDSDGNWQWNQAIAPGVLGLTVGKDGFVTKQFEFEAGKSNYDLQLVKAISVKGKLVDENGQPVSGIRVFAARTFQYFSSESASGHPNQSPSRSSRNDTDSQGDWRVDNWLDESISLIAIAKDGRFAILENANARVEHVIRFAPTKTVTVKVVDSAQNPVVGASLRALGWWRDHVSKQKALTNENGEVKLRLVPSVGVTWLIEKPGYRPTRYVVSEGNSFRDSIVLLKPLTLTAQIVDDATGQLIKNSRLEYRLDRPSFSGLAIGEKSPIINGVASERYSVSDMYISDEVQIDDGNIRMNCDLEFRSISLSVMAEGYETLPFESILYHDEQVVRQFRLKKSDGFSVIDVDGKPVADGYVVFDAQQAITTTDLDSGSLPVGAMRVGKDGHVSVDPKALRSCYQLVMAWSKDGCGLRRLCDLGANKPLQLEPWATVKLLDEDNHLNSKETTSLLVGSRGKRDFKWMPQYQGGIDLVSWNQQPRKQMTSVRLNLAPGQNVIFSPLGKHRVQGQIDLSSLGQSFLSEHSIHIQAGTNVCNDSVTVIHKSELGANGEFSFDHLCTGSYQLRIIATELFENNDHSTIGNVLPLRPSIANYFEFQPRDGEIEKNLGLISCVLSEYGENVIPILSPIGTAEINLGRDDFKNEKPVRFITLQKNWPVQEITFWSNQGEVLRKIWKKLDSMIEKNTFEPLEFTRSQSRFFLSTKGEIAAYDLFGSREWNAKRDGSHQFKFAGMLGDDLQVYQRSMTTSISLLSQETLRLQETAVPVMAVDECKFSERDGLYWSIGRKLVSFDKSGKRVSTANLHNSHSLRTYGGRLSLDEVNGGCWFLYMEHSFHGDSQFLNRVDSNGKLKFSTRLPQPTSPKLFPIAVVGGNCFIGASNRIVRYAADGQIISELPIDAKSLAAASDPNTLWALTKDGVSKIDISGQAMTVAETMPSILGDQLVVLE